MPDHRIKLFTPDPDADDPRRGDVSDIALAILERLEDGLAEQIRNNERLDTKEEPCSTSIKVELLPDGKKYDVKLHLTQTFAKKKAVKLAFWVRGEGENLSIVEETKLQREMNFNQKF